MRRIDFYASTYAIFTLRLLCALLLVLEFRAFADDSAAAVQQLPEPAKRFALVIGVEDYGDGITTLKGPNNDAHEIKRALENYGGFPSDQIVVLSSDQNEGGRPTHNQILKRLDRFANIVPPDGLLVVAFSGHGIEKDGEAFLLPSDAELGSVDLLRNTSLSLNTLRDAIKHIGVKQVMILLDACRDNPEESKGLQDNKMTSAYRMHGPDWNKVNTGIEAFAVVYATEEGKRAYIAAAKKQGYFSMALVDGVSGQAKNSKNEVTLGSLVNYLQDKVPKLVVRDLGQDKIQRPFADVRGYHADDLIIARVLEVNPALQYVLDVRLRPVLSKTTVAILTGTITGASDVAGEEAKWQDKVNDGSHLVDLFEYSLPLPGGNIVDSWSYDVSVVHVQTHELIRINLSEKEPASRGVRTAVSIDGKLTVDVTQAAQGWK